MFDSWKGSKVRMQASASRQACHELPVNLLESPQMLLRTLEPIQHRIDAEMSGT